jgi:hypothetical protein
MGRRRLHVSSGRILACEESLVRDLSMVKSLLPDDFVQLAPSCSLCRSASTPSQPRAHVFKISMRDLLFPALPTAKPRSCRWDHSMRRGCKAEVKTPANRRLPCSSQPSAIDIVQTPPHG